MQAQTLIPAYTALADTMAQMLAAAKQNNWDKVSELEAGYLENVAQIKVLERTSILAQETKSQKIEIIQRILADDHQLKLLIHPWMQKLSQWVQPSQSQAAQMQAKLNSAYQM
jgi:flagellar protein FliT